MGLSQAGLLLDISCVSGVLLCEARPWFETIFKSFQTLSNQVVFMIITSYKPHGLKGFETI